MSFCKRKEIGLSKKWAFAKERMGLSKEWAFAKE